MRFVKSHTTIPIPEIYDYNVSRSVECNTVGFPYVLMQAVDGRAVDGKVEDVIPEQYREKAIGQIADCLVQLSSLRFPSIGRIDAVKGSDEEYDIKPCFNPAGIVWPQTTGPFSTAIDYFFTSRTVDYQETIQRFQTDTDECFAAWLRLQTAVTVVQPGFNNGPFPLCHPDFRLSNILFDEDFNLTGVIDWTFTMTVPIEQFANLQPDLLSDGCRDLLLFHMQKYERKLDPLTPITNYLSAQGPAWKATVPLQCLTGVRDHRMEIARELLGHIYGKDATWKQIKKIWRRSAFYPKVVHEPE